MYKCVGAMALGGSKNCDESCVQLAAAITRSFGLSRMQCFFAAAWSGESSILFWI